METGSQRSHGWLERGVDVAQLTVLTRAGRDSSGLCGARVRLLSAGAMLCTMSCSWQVAVVGGDLTAAGRPIHKLHADKGGSP